MLVSMATPYPPPAPTSGILVILLLITAYPTQLAMASRVAGSCL